MKTIFKKLSALFGGDQPKQSQPYLPSSRHSQHSLLHDGSDTATRGQLVQVLLRDLVRKSGMPPGWIQCQIQVMNSRTNGKGIYVRLVVKHWDERLMKYAFAFQKALLTDIVQFEPKATSWLQGIAWQLEVAATCTVTELPGPAFWQAPTPAAKPFDQFAIVPLPATIATQPTPTVATPVVPPASAAPILPAMAVAATAPVPNAGIAAPDLQKAAESLASAAQAQQDETAQDLERLFAIRDNELSALADASMFPAGYESTEPLPLLKS